MNKKFFSMFIKGGYVVDPLNGLSKKMDIGISQPNIAEFIDPDTKDMISYNEFVDATDCYVVPGLIEFHAHLYPGGIDFAIEPDDLIRFGIVAGVDCGSAGFSTFPYFRKSLMEKSPIPINAVINLSRIGFVSVPSSELVSPQYINEEDLIHTIKVHQDTILGVKVRYQRNNINGDGLDILERAKKVCRATNTKLFAHITDAPVPFPEYIKYFDEGDVIIHMYHGRGHNILNPEGKVWPEAWEAKKRGVIFDCSRGTMHMNYKVAKTAMEQGFLPDVISSDTTIHSSNPLTCQLTTIMAELMELGMSFEDVLHRSTHVPAQLMKGVVSGIKIGLPANLTVLKMEDKDVTITDADGNIMTVSKTLIPQATISRGQVLYRVSN